MNKKIYNKSNFNTALSLILTSAIFSNNAIAFASNTESTLENNTINILDSNTTNKVKLSIEELLEYYYKSIYRSKVSDYIIGLDRNDTAVSLSSRAYNKSNTVILVKSNMNEKNIQADAQVAALLASTIDAPLLFTQTDRLPDATLKEVQRLEAKEIIVVGGEAAIPTNTLSTLTKSGIKIERLAGEGRWDTSAIVANKVADNIDVSKAIVINSSDNVNISAAVVASVTLNAPILYVNDKNIDPLVERFLSSSSIKEIYVIGTQEDPAGIAIPDSIFSKINSSKINRIKATTPSDVSNYFNSLFPEYKSESAFIINYDNTVDISVATAHAKKNGSPIFLVDKTIDENTLSKFNSGQFKNIYCISSTIYSETLNKIESAIYNSVYETDINMHDELKISKMVNGSSSEIAANLALSSYDKSDSVVLSLINQDSTVGSPDALISAPLSKALNAPFLSVESSKSIGTATKDAIKELGATKAYITGGTAAISEDVEKELISMGLTVERISGSDRWETSYNIAKKINSIYKIDTAIVISSKNLTDINSAVLASLELNAPILYSDGKSLTTNITSILNSNSIKKVYVIGAESTDENILIPESALNQIIDKTKLIKITGGNSINTLNTLRKDFKSKPKKEISKDIKNTGVIINHSNITDIVAGALYADKINGTPLLLGTLLDNESKNLALHNNLNDLRVISNDVYAFSHSQLEQVIFEDILKSNNLLETITIDDDGDNKDNIDTPDNGDNKDNIDTPDNGDNKDNIDTPDNGDNKDNIDTPDNGDNKDNIDAPDNGDNKDNIDAPDNGDNKDNINNDINKDNINNDINSDNNQEGNLNSNKANPQTGDDGLSMYLSGLSLSLTTLIGVFIYRLKLIKNNKK